MLLFTRPVLSTTSAFFISFSFAAAYVGSLYLSKNARVIFASVKYDGDGKTPRGKLDNERWRDDPDVIRARIIVVMFATLACCLAVFVVLWACSDGMVAFPLLIQRSDLYSLYLKFDSAFDATLLRLGFLPPGPFLLFDIRSYAAHFVTPILFLGPLFGSFLDGQLPGQENWTWNTHVRLRFFTIQGIRNYCVVSFGHECI